MDRIGRPNIQEVMNQLLGQEIWVLWPHMAEARVVGLGNNKQRYSLCYGSEGEFVKREDAAEGPRGEFSGQVKTVMETVGRGHRRDAHRLPGMPHDGEKVSCNRSLNCNGDVSTYSHYL